MSDSKHEHPYDHLLLIARHSSQAAPHPADGYVSTRPLGALYSREKTVFRVWAPTADRVTLHLYSSPVGNTPHSIITLDHSTGAEWDGTWETVVAGDQLGAYYTYTADGKDPRFNPSRELIDPYACAVTAHDGRAIVVYDATPVADRPTFPVEDAIIYELHVRDFTIDPDSGIQRRGKYLGLAEAGTHLTGRTDISTGIDHLSDLGVNVVQILPIGEFHTDESEDLYGWGYDNVHFNSPDGWYATERFDARRVGEVKRMIDALHRRGIRVVLDVVYNHTFEAVDKQRVYSFEGLVPGYYYRLKPDGSYWNGSGVGNEFRSEAPMARRFILDSVRYWVTEYKVDGFRFDLMGLIDDKTLELIVKELRAIDPNLLIYGEPWAGGTSPIELSHKGKQRERGWAVFNDHFRDALKGNVFNGRETGFVQTGNHGWGVRQGVRGAIDDFASSPLEAINYVECHDNHTLWDRLVISTVDNSTVTEADRRAMDKLAAAAIFTSQGIPFIQAGQEFLRTKGGDHNSYDKPDSVNMIRWRQKADNYDVSEYYRGLIKLRRTHPLFRLQTAAQVRRAVRFLDHDLGLSVPENCIAYQIEDVQEKDAWSRALVLLNPKPVTASFALPPGEWVIFGDGRRVRTAPLWQSISKLVDGHAVVAARGALILGEVREAGK
ncbi:MAG TPA: type I pullulanase [Blastocatellia bacterium]|nr:type I pullulanase [Blastocatellia bacterium]